MIHTTKPKKFCFVLMPFFEEFNDIYKLGIKQSCIDAGAYCERVDEQFFNESILERIYNQISKADILIADMTGRNPNVFYEVGYAHALGKTTILLTKEASDIPFDLKHYPHIIYNNSISKLKEELTLRVKWCIENNKDNDIDYKIDIDLYLESENLSTGNIVYITPKGKVPHPKLTIHNNTFHTYNPEDYRIGVITTQDYSNLRQGGSKTTKLPDGRLLHMLSFIEDILYPNSYTNFQIFLDSSKNYKDGQEVIIRLFTSVGTRDYNLKIDYDTEEE